jgi:signal transduction histidine kinase
MVAHDLREPVTGIAHLVTLLERRNETPPDPEVLNLMRASTERARGLIDGVLAYARAGELELAPVALGTLMAEVAEDLRPRLDAASATLDVGELPEVRGDARQLRRLLQNLVANAVKFRAERAPHVKVSAHAGREGWVVSVADNGVAIAAHDAARIFGMFARASGDHEAPASASPSAGASSRRTAARSGSSPPTAGAACSGSRCRADAQPIGTLASRPSAASHG